MDDKRAALMFSLLALAGAGARWALAPPAGAAPGDVRLAQGADTGPRPALRQTARQAERLARPLLPGERVDLDRADVIEITRLPRVGPALAQRIVAWRGAPGLLGGPARGAGVPGGAQKLLGPLGLFFFFGGATPQILCPPAGGAFLRFLI